LVIANEENSLQISDYFDAAEIYRYESSDIYSRIKSFLKKAKKHGWTLYRVTAKNTDSRNE
jgi:hypothetical protein